MSKSKIIKYHGLIVINENPTKIDTKIVYDPKVGIWRVNIKSRINKI